HRRVVNPALSRVEAHAAAARTGRAHARPDGVRQLPARGAVTASALGRARLRGAPLDGHAPGRPLRGLGGAGAPREGRSGVLSAGALNRDWQRLASLRHARASASTRHYEVFDTSSKGKETITSTRCLTPRRRGRDERLKEVERHYEVFDTSWKRRAPEGGRATFPLLRRRAVSRAVSGKAGTRTPEKRQTGPPVATVRMLRKRHPETRGTVP